MNTYDPNIGQSLPFLLDLHFQKLSSYKIADNPKMIFVFKSERFSSWLLYIEKENVSRVLFRTGLRM